MSVLRIDNRVPYKYGWTNQNRIFFCIYLLARSSSCAGGQDMTRDNATRPDRQKPRRSFVSTTVCPTNTDEPIWTECFFIFIYFAGRPFALVDRTWREIIQQVQADTKTFSVFRVLYEHGWTDQDWIFFYIYLLPRSSVRAGGQDVARDNAPGPGRHQGPVGPSYRQDSRETRQVQRTARADPEGSERLPREEAALLRPVLLPLQRRAARDPVRDEGPDARPGRSVAGLASVGFLGFGCSGFQSKLKSSEAQNLDCF